MNTKQSMMKIANVDVLSQFQRPKMIPPAIMEPLGKQRNHNTIGHPITSGDYTHNSMNSLCNLFLHM